MVNRALAAASVLLALGSGHGAYGASPPVKVSLRSAFPAADTLFEALEAIALENSTALFPLLSHFPLSGLPSSYTPQDAHTRVFDLAQEYKLLDGGSLSSARTLLGLHAAAPRLAVSAQHYEDRLQQETSGRAGGKGCESWVDWYGEVLCDAEELKTKVSSAPGDPDYMAFKSLPFDYAHALPPSLDEPPFKVVHYADPTANGFAPIHAALLSLEPKVEYVLRWARTARSGESEGSLTDYLSGYGVALDLKKMDYLVIDDRAHRSDDAASSTNDEDLKTEEGEAMRTPEEILTCIFESLPYVDEAAKERAKANEPLTEDEIAALGMKATQFISRFSSRPHDASLYVHPCWDNHHQAPPDQLTLMSVLSRSFPLYATPLARKVELTEGVVDEVYENWEKATPGVGALWINGRALEQKDGQDGNIFSLLRTIRRERALVQSIMDLGLTGEQAVEVLMHPAYTKWADALDGIVDASDRPEGGDVVLWWNDIETEDRYQSFRPALTGLMRMHPAALFSPMLQIRANIINTVLVLDLSSPSSLAFLSNQVEGIVARGYPVRWGLVPAVETDHAMVMARLVYYVHGRYGSKAMVGFIKSVTGNHDHIVSWDAVRSVFASFEPAHTFDEVAEGVVPLSKPAEAGETQEEAINDQLDVIKKARQYSKRLGQPKNDGLGGHGFVNGRYIELNDWITFSQGFQTESMLHLQFLQELVYTGQLKDTDIPLVSTLFYDLPGTPSRRNPYIHQAQAKGDAKIFSLPELFKESGFTRGKDAFVVPEGSEKHPITMYVVGDFDSPAGRAVLKESLEFTKLNSRSRVTFVHNPATDSDQLIRKLGLEAHTFEHSSQKSFSIEEFDDVLQKDVALNRAPTKLILRKLGLAPGDLAILVNGRLVGPIAPESGFVAEDFATLESYELKKRVERVEIALDDVLEQDSEKPRDAATYSHLASMISSIVASIQQPDPSEVGLFDAAQRPRSASYRKLSGQYTLSWIGTKDYSKTQMTLLIDPLSEMAQKWSSILDCWFDLFPDVYLEVYMNPTQHSEIPLKRFYRSNIQSRLQYNGQGQEVPAIVEFAGLPVEPIYTLAMDVPPSWLVRPREAMYDLDNIQLSTLSPEDRTTGLQALFALDYIVIEGHARETIADSPPSGLQLELTPTSSTTSESNTTTVPVDDTLVVANLGYFQFKAKPGVFELGIREGRGREVYMLESVGAQGWDSPSVEKVGRELAVMSLEGATIYPRFGRKPGMDGVSVLEQPEAYDAHSGGILDNIVVSEFLSPKARQTDLAVSGKPQAEINIFTVASGHLYERFASIMILSVLRNTKSTVKFWFIENFLSPSFLEFIPHMAEEYGFQYELVTYKWPSWLRAQKEKQRIIWAYKILFLDVLFPMDLKKVIFVDADQIVRADLQELVDLDLHGAPYGYTPMGNDNTDMEGFRFWKTGYWADFLNGRPYHISALYVVDLVRFRAMAAGDMLRGHYHALSADPNSLANLDQDLPNNLQMSVPIFSLDEDWLWCETWCIKDRLHRAKTIDLCQNPLTKEPKLSRARQIPEWDLYDTEIANFSRRLAEQGKIHSSAATADTTVLANEAAAKAVVADGAERSEDPPGESHSGGRQVDEL
ncbi:glycosyltransferase family 24 protein [Coniophora puteana RWD-64-598 SS2]|uniref:Glycosyltransferase family 24 protein n=1 Tax=Coniophora puteana (strain RWD-64-598) TaxID=741705 RepID=A0A5M3MH05_CONPW|nr:glycosyltransferase family 24 protein [Coniophora puteana RWD-64-598 SS2]EIW78230.1 glycosyltransferase family 24 protein [Coniophora puteana RWD-64-598 SS2]